MGRYLERAQHQSRLLQLQTAALVDRPVHEIYFGWNRIYISANRLPPGGNLELTDSDEFTLADSFTLADDLTFERSNPGSLWNCFAMARENARQTRNCISGEMWSHLNVVYLRLQKLDIQAIWSTSPESFYSEITYEIDTFMGVAAATMYRDEGWHFLQLGRFMERAQLAISLFLAQLAAEGHFEEASEADWTSLLRVYHALEVYNRSYSVDVQPDQVLDLLANDPLLPDSLCQSLEVVGEQLDAIGEGPNASTSGAMRRLAGRLGAQILYAWPDLEDHKEVLLEMGGYCRDLHDAIALTYFDYQVEDSAV
jgi:uncharacterized alpha-E superfamily protein